MTITTTNKTIYAGENTSQAFIITDSLNAVRNIQYGVFTWTLFHPLKGDVIIKDNALLGGLVMGTPVLGQIAVTLTAAETEVLAPLTYKYQLKMVLSGTTTIEAEGNFIVKPSRMP